MEDIKCPKCGSSQLSADKKGFSGGKAVAGAVLTGGIGLVAGFHGSKQIMITCLSCGFQHKAGDYQKEKLKFDQRKRSSGPITPRQEKEMIIAIWIFAALIGWISYLLFSNHWNFFGTIFCLATILLIIFGIILMLEKKK